jgi:5'(3')-deoxyribonucleotidase
VSLRIGVDLDGVLADFEAGFAPILEKLTGMPFPVGRGKEPPAWDWPELMGATKVEVERAWQIARNSPTFWRALPVLPGAESALPVLERAACDGHHLYFITSREGQLVQWQSADWVRWATGILCPSVLVCDLKPLAAAALRLDALIDDAPPNLSALPRRCRGYLVNRLHNATAQGDWTRVESCAAALEQILD